MTIQTFLEEVKQREAKATPGIWRCDYCGEVYDASDMRWKIEYFLASHQHGEEFWSATWFGDKSDVPTAVKLIEVLLGLVEHQGFCRKSALGDSMRDLVIRHAVREDVCTCGLDAAIAAVLAEAGK